MDGVGLLSLSSGFPLSNILRWGLGVRCKFIHRDSDIGCVMVR